MTGLPLAGSCFNAFRNAAISQGCPTYPEWNDLDESYQEGFVAAAKFAEDFLGGENEGASGYRMFGLNCYWQFCRAAGETPLEQDLVPADTVRAWEAFARHANNMLDFDASTEEEGLEPHEAYWSDWAAAKKAAAGMPQPQADALPPIEEPRPLTRSAPHQKPQPADAPRPDEEDL